MKEIHALVRRSVETGRLMKTTDLLWREERGATFEHYRRSARLVERLMKEAGMESVERVEHPADGKTAFQDKVMPMAWRARRGKLEIIDSAVSFEDPVVADFERHPLHLLKDSAGTPREGVVARLASEEDLFSGADLRGAMVLLNPENHPGGPIFSRLCDAGALGVVSDYLVGRYFTPGGIHWGNAFAEGPGWHRSAEGRALVGFAVSPETGDRLRAAMRAGPVTVRATSDASHYPGTFETVTGILPGREAREVWLMAHLYEPLPDDNSAGVAGALEIARVLGRLRAEGRLPAGRFSLRLVFSLEKYGFAAYAEKRGGFLGDRVLAAFNMDALPVVDGVPAKLVLSAPGASFFGDCLLEEMAARGLAGRLTIRETVRQGQYSDDMLLADRTVGLPSLWLTRSRPARNDCLVPNLHHNSGQTMEIIRPGLFQDTVAFIGTWAQMTTGLEPGMIPGEIRRASLKARAHLFDEGMRVLSGQAFSGSGAGDLEMRARREAARLEDFRRLTSEPDHLRLLEAEIARLESEREALARSAAGLARAPEEPSGTAWELAGRTIVRRLSRGLPSDLVRMPFRERKPASGAVNRVLASADGEKTLARLMREARWETSGEIAWSAAGSVLGSIQRLERHGYVRVDCPAAAEAGDLAAALGRAGVLPGDLLLVHGSLSALGFVKGGAEALVEALLDYLGPEGTLLMPTFTGSFVYQVGIGPVHRRSFRPFHPLKTPSLTGALSECFRHRAGVRRSVHPSHSVAGFGPLVDACLGEHRQEDSPTGRSSPFGKLLELGGKMAWLGAGLSSATFLHFIETELRLPYLVPAVCVVEDGEGAPRSLLVPGHPAGHRDFYRKPAEESAVFRALDAAGLEIRSAPFGTGRLRVIEAAPFFEAGMKVVSREPDIMLCREDSCVFCARGRALPR